MKQLTIYRDNYNGSTVIPNSFIDHYMKDANDAQLKIYLYLIRVISAHLTTDISDMADKFNYTEKDVLRALKYWDKKGLLALEYEITGDTRTLSAIHLKEADNLPTIALQISASQGEPKKPEEEPKKPDNDPYAKPAYSLDQIKEFKDNEEIPQLLFVAEQYLGKTLSVSEIKTIFFFYDRLHFSIDLIDYLIQYCVDRGKKSFRYIEKVAVGWAEEGITTPKQAARQTRKYDKIVYQIMEALGKTSNPTNAEADFILRWVKEFGFTSDVIFEACTRTVRNTDKYRFEYADSILTNWHNQNVHHKSDIQKLDEAHTKNKPVIQRSKSPQVNKFNQFQQNNYEFDVLEQEILSN